MTFQSRVMQATLPNMAFVVADRLGDKGAAAHLQRQAAADAAHVRR